MSVVRTHERTSVYDAGARTCIARIEGVCMRKHPGVAAVLLLTSVLAAAPQAAESPVGHLTVSYTHLTLPTILLV